MSLWLAKRILPLLAYRTTSRWATGAGGGPPGTARPIYAPRPVPASAATVSGSSFTPVGPAWISVPMAGQTPQS